MKPLKNDMFEKLAKLVKIVDDLRDEGLQDHIKLPRIAVLGSQSSGKSSLLEMIVGLDFLPRGDGVVTRRPLELRLKHILPTGPDDKPWAVFEKTTEKMFDFDKVRAKINEITDRDAGTKKNIIPSPIVVSIFSTTCPDLTIIDLPGITRIPLTGSEQPHNIEQITKDMARFYVEDSRTIILCVIPANADISTSDGLQMARDLDPAGLRTIGVITKIDIMDHGTDATKMLLGKDINLKLGYVGVVGRSQKDISENMRVDKGLKKEADFFSRTDPYDSLPNRDTILGTKALVNKLTTEMYKHIADSMPEIESEINVKLEETNMKLERLGESIPIEETDKQSHLFRLTREYLSLLENKIKGKFDENSKITLRNESNFSFGAQIRFIFKELYNDMTDNYLASKHYSNDHFIEKIKKYQGDSLPGFPTIGLFLDLINPELEKLRGPAYDCLDKVFELLLNLSNEIIREQCGRFPVFMNEFVDFTSKILEKEKEEARRIIKYLIEAEMGYLYTCDKDYEKIYVVNDGKEKNLIQGIDPKFIEHLKSKMDIYFSLIVKILRDSIPKTIGYFLIKESQEKLNFELFNTFSKNYDNVNMLHEAPEIEQERKALYRISKTLANCQRLLKNDPEIIEIKNYGGFNAIYKKETDKAKQDKKPEVLAAHVQGKTVPLQAPAQQGNVVKGSNPANTLQMPKEQNFFGGPISNAKPKQMVFEEKKADPNQKPMSAGQNAPLKPAANVYQPPAQANTNKTPFGRQPIFDMPNKGNESEIKNLKQQHNLMSESPPKKTEPPKQEKKADTSLFGGLFGPSQKK